MAPALDALALPDESAIVGDEVPDADPEAEPESDILPLLALESADVEFPLESEDVEFPPEPDDVEFPPEYRFVFGAIAAKALKLYSCVESLKVKLLGLTLRTSLLSRVRVAEIVSPALRGMESCVKP